MKKNTIAFLIAVLLSPAGASQNRQIISFLEIMDIETGSREIVYQDTSHFEAPNWSRDGNELFFNRSGYIYRIPVEGGTPVRIDTGFANRNNNDHVLSPGGTHMGISHHSAEDNGASIIYIVSTNGGVPLRITPKGPSYLHGWSPDGGELAYCALRNGRYDIYVIPVKEGDEVALTNSPSHDDGPDYSPCGRYIWFNSDRSGSMKIWKMERDGSNPVQMTFGEEYNDWFPHPSPDGEHVALLSYEGDVEGHPANKKVWLRLMPAAGGDPVVLTELFGGQGTINVPSWSPDSKRFAFVSYRLVDR